MLGGEPGRLAAILHRKAKVRNGLPRAIAAAACAVAAESGRVQAGALTEIKSVDRLRSCGIAHDAAKAGALAWVRRNCFAACSEDAQGWPGWIGAA
jgi:hypothetical protein